MSSKQWAASTARLSCSTCVPETNTRIETARLGFSARMYLDARDTQMPGGWLICRGISHIGYCGCLFLFAFCNEGNRSSRSQLPETQPDPQGTWRHINITGYWILRTEWSMELHRPDATPSRQVHVQVIDGVAGFLLSWLLTGCLWVRTKPVTFPQTR